MIQIMLFPGGPIEAKMPCQCGSAAVVTVGDGMPYFRCSRCGTPGTLDMQAAERLLHAIGASGRDLFATIELARDINRGAVAIGGGR